MIAHTSAELSRIMWEIDPMGTCCTVNEGMEDEYDSIAATVIELSKTMTDKAAMKQAIVYWFDDYLYQKKQAKLNKCLKHLSYKKR